MQSFYGLNHAEFHAFAATTSLSRAALKSIYLSSFKAGPQAVENWPARWQQELSQKYNWELPRRERIETCEDGTIKFLHILRDGLSVETVLIPFHKRYTVCLSTQVGCAMKCSFCFTGKQGLKRHLQSSEIVAQYISAFLYLKENSAGQVLAPSVVFMGQGEPLHNFEEVKKSIQILLDERGVGLGHRQITLSTSGFLPGLKRWEELGPINLAVSLHAASDDLRNELIPINEKWPLRELFGELDQIKLLSRQFITFEYLLIDGLNDREQDIVELTTWLKGRPALINIIPFNPFPGSHYQRPSAAKARAFKEALLAQGLRAMVRTTKGDEILAACGQLNTAN